MSRWLEVTLCGAPALCAVALGAPGSLPTPQASPKAQLASRYTPGQVLHYALESTTTTQTHRGGIVSDPQGAATMTVVWNATVRLEVLPSKPLAGAKTAGGLRLRTTFETSAATQQTDVYDPQAQSVEDDYRKLQGRALEFLLDSAGRVISMSGLSEQEQSSAAQAARSWIAQLSAASGAPHEVAIGDSWSSEQAVPASPLAGLVWHSRSSYLRNEPCKPARTPGQADPLSSQTCAVILTKVTLTGTRGPDQDATPPSYRKMNLRTAGDWTGEGESLSYVSLATGNIVSVTKSSDEKMDFTVSSSFSHEVLRYNGAVKTHSQLSLLP
jgi:hypothetical protein